MPEPEDASGIAIPLVWGGVDDLPVYASNQAMVQLNPGADGRPDSIILTLGFVAPPVVLGTRAEQQQAMESLGRIAVRPLSRASMTIGRAKELVEVLSRQITVVEDME